MIGRLIRSFSSISLMLIFFGCIILGVEIKSGEFPQILLPSHDYDYVLDNGLKEGQHIKGEICFSLGSFATEESYQQNGNSRTAAKTTGYYYMIPVGEGGMAAVLIRKDDMKAMETLTEETYDYLMGGNPPQTEVHFEGVAVKMEKNLKGLEDAFRSGLKEMGYTESEIEEILSSYSDGKCLVLSGPAAMSTLYVMLGIAFVLILTGIILIIRNYKKEKEYDDANAN